MGFLVTAAMVAMVWLQRDSQSETPLLVKTKRKKEPHIIFFLVDDQGINDMGENSTDLKWATPRLTDLEQQSVRFDRYYTMSLCTPSRAALLTGLHPITTGMQMGMITGNEPWGLPLEYPLMPQLTSHRSYMYGKWHIGHFASDYVPRNRGFDIFVGSYAGFIDHNSHTAEVTFCDDDGAGCWYDLHDGEDPVAGNFYALDYLRDRAVKDLLNHDPKEAALVYFAPPTVHAPIQAPPTLEHKLKHLNEITNPRRRSFAAMTLATDYAAGALVDAAKNASLWDDTIFVFASDNGAMPWQAGSNFPLRGMKGFLFEGGVKVHAFIHAPQYLRPGTYPHLFSVQDWIPTLLGVSVSNSIVDGVNHWSALRAGTEPPPRTSLLLNAVEYACDDSSTASECREATNYATGGLIDGRYKLLRNVAWLPVWPVLSDEVDLNWNLDGPLSDYLFDILDDPSETTDLKDVLPDIFNDLLAKFHRFLALARPSLYCPFSDDDAAIAVFNETNFIGPWRQGTGRFDDGGTCREPLKNSSSQSSDFPATDYCRYGLLPTSSCVQYPPPL